MDRSQYLAAALQAMGQPQQQAPQGGMSLQQMQDVTQKREAFEKANPGQSYAMHGLKQLGQNVLGAPGALAAAPGNALSGLQNLAKGLPGLGG